MGNDVVQWRAVIGNFYITTHSSLGTRFTFWCPMKSLRNCFSLLLQFCVLILITKNVWLTCNTNYTFIIMLLLLLCGDIEQNPGPDEREVENTPHLSVAHLNIRSIRNKVDFIENSFSDFQVICLTETHISNDFDSSKILLENLNLYRNDCTNFSGGLITYVNCELFSKRRDDLESPNIQTLWVEVKYKNKNILICNVYRPPSSPVSFWENFNICIEKALDVNSNLLIVGDINENQLLTANNKFNQIMIMNSLNSFITEPTRVTPYSSTLIDPIAISNDLEPINYGVIDIPSDISDHKSTYVHIKFPSNISATLKRTVWLYKRADYDKLNTLIANENWDFIELETINNATSNFTQKLLDLIKTCIPSKEVTIRKNDKPWYDNEVRKFSRKRDRMKATALRTNNPNHWSRYKYLRNKVNNLKKHAKESFYSNLEEIVFNATANDQKTYWKMLRQFVNKNKPLNVIPPLESDTTLEIAFTDEDKANQLNDYFVSISTLNDQTAQLPNFQPLSESIIENINLSENEIEEVIQTLLPNKAVGEDLIGHRVLKNIKSTISKPLCMLYNKSLSECSFPDPWKSAIVMPLFKKGDSHKASNYRPISLLSCVAKLMERVVYKHIYNHLVSNNLIYAKQSGFLTGHSTVYQLIDIYHQLSQSQDIKSSTCIVFCDISKAFDRVWHKGLLFKLKQNGIGGPILKWIDSYLSNRKQKVFVNSSYSCIKSTNAGVPQCSVLGPLLFLVFVNDIVEKLLCIARLFADDTSIAFTSRNTQDIEAIINQDLQLISCWAKQWLVSFNPNKTQALFFSHRVNENPPMLLFENIPVQFVDSHKHLGVSLSKNGKWHDHIDNLLKSASSILAMMRKIKYSVNKKTLSQLYTSFLRPILEYSSVVWDGCTQSEQDSLEKIQHEAARIVTGLTRSVSLSNLYKEINWLSLADRRKYHKLILTYKIKSGITPGYLNELFPSTIDTATPYPLRNSDDFVVLNRRTELFAKSFVPSAITLWNSLPANIKSLETLNQFKNALNTSLFKRHKVPTYFNYGERYFSVLHSRLRNKCSNLNFDLFTNHLKDNGSCECGSEREDAEHYFFQCNFYINERLKLFRSTHPFHPLSTNKLLFGCSELSIEANEKIFASVQTFIKDTRRFTA